MEIIFSAPYGSSRVGFEKCLNSTRVFMQLDSNVRVDHLHDPNLTRPDYSLTRITRVRLEFIYKNFFSSNLYMIGKTM